MKKRKHISKFNQVLFPFNGFMNTLILHTVNSLSREGYCYQGSNVQQMSIRINNQHIRELLPLMQIKPSQNQGLMVPSFSQNIMK
jgi:hypothetical protein